jgi:hypothetical protein
MIFLSFWFYLWRLESLAWSNIATSSSLFYISSASPLRRVTNNSFFLVISDFYYYFSFKIFWLFYYGDNSISFLYFLLFWITIRRLMFYYRRWAFYRRNWPSSSKEILDDEFRLDIKLLYLNYGDLVTVIILRLELSGLGVFRGVVQKAFFLEIVYIRLIIIFIKNN